MQNSESSKSREDVEIPLGNGFVRFNPIRLFQNQGLGKKFLLIWLLLVTFLIPSGMLTRWFELTGMHLELGNISVYLTLYIPMIFCVLLVMWVGYWWAAIPAYLSSFMVAYIGGMPLEWIFIFALANPIGLAIYAMFYRVTPMRTDLRGVESLVGFIMIALVASLAGSIGALIWALTNNVGLNVAHPVWLGWWLGGWFQAVLLVGPILYFFGPKIEQRLAKLKNSRLHLNNAQGAMVAMIASFLTILVGFVSAGRFISLKQMNAIDWANGQLMNFEQAQNTIDSLSYPLFILLSVMFALAYLSYRAVMYWHETMRGVNEKLSNSNQKLVNLVNLDPLSGLFNRRKVFEQLEQNFIRSKRTGEVLSIIMVDADKFKSVNDNYGHMVGDDVIKAISKCISKCMREYDIAGRYGGEEFIALLPNTSREQAEIVAERIRYEIGQLIIQTDKGELHVSVSLGVSAFIESDEKGEQIVDRADRALLKAKDSGRNRVEVG